MSKRVHFAITAPGLESVCAAELRALGENGRVIDGGVEWQGDIRSLCRANLHLRSASRVVSRLGTFRARGFPELERHAARLPWAELVPSGTRIALRVTSRKSRLYHEGAIAERLSRVIRDGAGAEMVDARRSDDDDDAGDDALLIVVRVFRDDFMLSVDASGRLLHQRGYRRDIARAPLRETLAAAMLLTCGWDPATSLLDPMCGSGTIPIEAALIARRIPPGLANAERIPRRFAFEQRADFDEEVWSDVVADARSAIRDAPAAGIRGTDRSSGAITAARANAARAGVDGDIELEQSPLSALTPITTSGALVTNPPYGVRVGERRTLRTLYEELGRVARDRVPGWSVSILAADTRLAAAAGLPFEERLRTKNGGIDVVLLSTGPAQDRGTHADEAGTTAVNTNRERNR